MMDNRHLFVMLALSRHAAPVGLTDIMPRGIADPAVVSKVLHSELAKGNVEFRQVKHQKYWNITDAGREAINTHATPACIIP